MTREKSRPKGFTTHFVKGSVSICTLSLLARVAEVLISRLDDFDLFELFGREGFLRPRFVRTISSQVVIEYVVTREKKRAHLSERVKFCNLFFELVVDCSTRFTRRKVSSIRSRARRKRALVPSRCLLRVVLPANEGVTMMTSYDWTCRMQDVSRGDRERNAARNEQHRIHLESHRTRGQ